MGCRPAAPRDAPSCLLPGTPGELWSNALTDRRPGPLSVGAPPAWGGKGVLPASEALGLGTGSALRLLFVD